jgi:hypothetical protein
VVSRDGRTVEDSVACEVGRAIAQSLPGIVPSTDGRVALRFPEQALLAPFRVFSVVPAAACGVAAPPPPAGATTVGSVYRIREPGDRFMKDVTLEFRVGKDELGGGDTREVHLCAFNAPQERWDRLPTHWDEAAGTFSTPLRELPRPQALFGLFRLPGTPAKSPEAPPAQPAIQPEGGRLLHCAFETDLGTFRSTDHWVGARLERDNTATPDGSYCLKLVNPASPGPFSCTVCAAPFDVRQYPVFGFDYRIGAGVQIDVLLRVAGRWYSLGFTGAPTDYRNRDVNIASLDRLPGVVADDQWHSVGVDLRRALARVTAETVVDEIRFADWRVGGYRKLELGRNAVGAAFYLDNVRLEGSGAAPADPPELWVQDFNSPGGTNNLGGTFGSYGNPGSHACSWSREPGGVLRFEYDVTATNTYAGYWTALQGRDLLGYRSLEFRVRSDGPLPPVRVGIRDKAGLEGKMPLEGYAGPPDREGWREVRMPLRIVYVPAFQAPPDVLFVGGSAAERCGKGRLQLDDLRFGNSLDARVADFDWPYEWNRLGGHCTIQENGAAALSAAVIPDPWAPGTASNRVLRISFGGTIGREYGGDGTYSFAQWTCALRYYDARPFTHLSLRIRGERGGERPNLYLADPNRRAACRGGILPPVTREWQAWRLPLEHFATRGVDLSCLESLQVVFEWEEQSGTVYVDDIRFEGRSVATPTAGATTR